MAVGLAAGLLAGCGGAGPRWGLVSGAGEPVGAAALAHAARDARVVYVGERHDRAEDHEAQLAILEALHAADPSLAIGVEMVQRPFQAALDAWSRGEIDEETLVSRTEWGERWRVDFALYRPIFAFARAHGLRIVALNAPRELTRAVARDGLDAVPEALRAELPEIDASDAEHRAMVEAALGEHEGMDPARLERFYQAQLVWDETMAESVARTMTAPDAPRRMVVLAGRMHVERGLGIPRRATRRGAGPAFVVLPLSPDELPPADQLCDYAIRTVD